MGHRRSSRPRSGGDAGVTAVELIVVVGLVVVLIFVAVTSVNGIRDRQRSSACASELKKVQTAVEAYRAMPGSRSTFATPPKNLAALKAASLLDADVGRYVAYSRARSGGRWTVHYANGPKGNCIVS